MTLDAKIKKVMTESLEGDAIGESIEKHCSEAIDSVIRDAFSYSSDFRKALKAKVESVMPVLDETDLAVFVNAVRHVTQSRLVSLADDQAKKVVGEMLDKLLPDGNVITFEEFEKSFREKLNIDEDAYEHEMVDHDYTFELIESETSDGFFDLKCSEDCDAGDYCHGTTSLRFKTGEDGLLECWYVKMGSVEIPKDSPFVGPLYGFDAMVFRLYTGAARLKVK